MPFPLNPVIGKIFAMSPHSLEVLYGQRFSPLAHFVIRLIRLLEGERIERPDFYT